MEWSDRSHLVASATQDLGISIGEAKRRSVPQHVHLCQGLGKESHLAHNARTNVQKIVKILAFSLVDHKKIHKPVVK